MSDDALRRARRAIERSDIKIRGVDQQGRQHSRVRTLGRLDWRIEGGPTGPAVAPGSRAARKFAASRGARVVPITSHYWQAG